MIMTSGSEINIEHASHQPAIHNPDRYAVFQLLP
jgi:hypothetical protein